ncbi:unnamed protein product [Moneuplotes crassus]|uniref:Uncharacterized protein n=1 Tax=Euplotes crassus TaxID=5936 RepID=A0AAD1UBP3_EUPCR|nr:unnamed protein product [Moneuplotes crassus]
MNKFQQFDENLSDEILDEHALVCSVKKLANLEKNMSDSPFHRSVCAIIHRPSGFKSLDFAKSCDVYVKKEIPKNKSENYMTPEHTKKIKSQQPSAKPSLQSDIKSLLRQAMDIRYKSQNSPLPEEILDEIKMDVNLRKKLYNREVTMKDIQKA